MCSRVLKEQNVARLQAMLLKHAQMASLLLQQPAPVDGFARLQVQVPCAPLEMLEVAHPELCVASATLHTNNAFRVVKIGHGVHNNPVPVVPHARFTSEVIFSARKSVSQTFS